MAEREGGSLPRAPRHPADYEKPIYVQCWGVDGEVWEVLVDERGEPIVSSGTYNKWRTVWVRWTLTRKQNQIRNVAQVEIDPRAVTWKRLRPGAFTLHGPAAEGRRY